MQWHSPPFKLKEIKLEVTHNCLLNCLHCSSMAGVDCERQMNKNDCQRIINEAAGMGVTQIAFSGGEPLLWNGIEEMISQALNYAMNSSLYTTGNVPNVKKLIKRLYSIGLKQIIFSIYSIEATIHDHVTNVSGSYYNTINVVKFCIEIGLKTEFHFVPLSTNYKELVHITQKAREIGVERVSVLRLVPQGRSAKNRSLLLNKKQNKKLRSIILNLRNDGHNIRTGSPYNFLMINSDPQCKSGIDRITVGPNLDITPCDAFKQISPIDIGVDSDFSNLHKHSLLECWEKSSYLSAIRKYLTTDFKSPCSECSSIEQCLSGCMAQKFIKHRQLLKCADPACLFTS